MGRGPETLGQGTAGLGSRPAAGVDAGRMAARQARYRWQRRARSIPWPPAPRRPLRFRPTRKTNLGRSNRRPGFLPGAEVSRGRDGRGPREPVRGEEDLAEGSLRSWIAVVLSGLPDLDLRLLAEAVVRHEDDPHAPSGVGDDEASELAPGELLPRRRDFTRVKSGSPARQGGARERPARPPARGPDIPDRAGRAACRSPHGRRSRQRRPAGVGGCSGKAGHGGSDCTLAARDSRPMAWPGQAGRAWPSGPRKEGRPRIGDNLAGGFVVASGSGLEVFVWGRREVRGGRPRALER